MTARVKPTMPGQVIVGPYTYTVDCDELELAKSGVQFRDALNGVCYSDKLRIVLDADLAPGMALDVLLHEVLHACTHATGLAAEFDDDTEEKIVRRLSTLLLDVLRRNPDLVAWLTRPLP